VKVQQNDTYYSCNGCFDRIPEGVNRYHCTGKKIFRIMFIFVITSYLECSDFDYCEKCYKQLGHDHYMVVETIRSAAIQAKIQSYSTTQNMM